MRVPGPAASAPTSKRARASSRPASAPGMPAARCRASGKQGEGLVPVTKAEDSHAASHTAVGAVSAASSGVRMNTPPRAAPLRGELSCSKRRKRASASAAVCGASTPSRRCKRSQTSPQSRCTPRVSILSGASPGHLAKANTRSKYSSQRTSGWRRARPLCSAHNWSSKLNNCGQAWAGRRK